MDFLPPWIALRSTVVYRFMVVEAKKVLAFASVFILGINILIGQVIVPGDHVRTYYDLLLFQDTTLNKPINQYPSIVDGYHEENTPSWNIWKNYMRFQDGKFGHLNTFQWVNPIVRFNYNSLTPRSYNDGSQWNGRGLNAYVSGGLSGQVGVLHYAFVPAINVSQNREFEIPNNLSADRHPFAYPFDRGIDWVQRYGNGTYINFDWGQSELRLVRKNATIGLSTENFRWGVAQLNPILMSYNAAGFPHLDIGTYVPAKTKIGRVEGRMFWGVLFESDYFDDNPAVETGYITGFHIGYEPVFFPQLKIGLNRVMNTRWSDGNLSFTDFFASFLQNTHNDNLKNDEYDQMVSINLDFSFPEVGFRTYLEFARNDFPGNVPELLEYPDRSRAYTLGFMKTFENRVGKLLSILFETTVLSGNQLRGFVSGTPTYYVHPFSVRGYTNRGQIMGAGIGPGANSNFLRVDLYRPDGKWGFTFSRIRFNDDFLIKNASSGLYETDFEIALGLEYVKFIERWSLSPYFLWAFRKNWYFDDVREVSNFMVGINLFYQIKQD